jgi:thiol-disulfide isomerase/thioredoxin
MFNIICRLPYKFLVPLICVSFACNSPKNTAALIHKPIRVLTNEKLRIEVHDYNSFEPLLNIQNDSIYIFNFWATWCKPCIAELPDFNRIQETYNSKKVKVYLINIDLEKEIDQTIFTFIQKRNLFSAEFMILDDPDANRWIDSIHKEWSGGIPATLIINRNKRQFYERSFTFTELESELKKYLH